MSWEQDAPGLPPAPPPAPRRVTGSAVTWNAGFGLLFGGIWLGITLTITVVLNVVQAPFWDDVLLDRRGQRTSGEPYAVVGTGSSVNDEDLMEIRLSYRDARGSPQQAAIRTTDGTLLARANQHQRIDIEYDPESPGRARAVGETASMLGWWAALPLGLGLLVGAPSFFGGLWSVVRTRGIYRHGVATVATVDKHEATASTENDETLMLMHYVFRTPRGAARGRWKTVSPKPIGTRFWVLYDPRAPSRNVPAGGWERAGEPGAATPPAQPPPAQRGPKMYV